MAAVLTLVREAPDPAVYFPIPVRNLVEFVLARPGLLPALFDYLASVKVTDPESVRAEVLDVSLRKYPRAKRYSRVVRAELWRLLNSVYALKLPGNKDPRGVVVEYLVFQSDRIGNRHEPQYVKEYECSVRWRLPNGQTKRLIDSKATFDVAWLSDISFRGYECKCQVAPFVSWSGGLSSGARNKLQFMQGTVLELRKLGRDSRSYLVGLDRSVEDVRELLAAENFLEIEIVDGDQLELLLA